MKRRIRGLICYIAAIIGGGNVLAAPADMITFPSSPGDLVCGPRCVEFLLQHYGRHDEDLISLVRETQWPNLEQGATLERLNGALNRRRVHTFPMRIPQSAGIVWPHPVLVHLRGDPDSAGHYAVWLPIAQNEDEVVLWDGLSGVRSLSQAAFASQRSGAILLTSPDMIRTPDEAVHAAGEARIPVFWTSTALFSAALTFLTISFLVIRRRKRGRWHQPEGRET